MTPDECEEAVRRVLREEAATGEGIPPTNPHAFGRLLGRIDTAARGTDAAVSGSVAHRGVLATGDDPGVWWWVTAAGTRVAVDPVLAQRLYASKLVRVQAVDPLAPYPWPQAELDQVPVAAPAVPPTG